jgi:hypothetical protein
MAPRRGPLGSSPDGENFIGNAPALVPGHLARRPTIGPTAAHGVIAPGTVHKAVRLADGAAVAIKKVRNARRWVFASELKLSKPSLYLQ